MRGLVALLPYLVIVLHVGACTSLSNSEPSPNAAISASCQDVRFYFTLTDLRQLVKADFEKRGGKFYDEWRVNVKTNGCNYLIHVVQVPERPGGFYSLAVSAITGQIIGHFGGT